MFTSDVSARGVDYPDVTRVIQVGLTTREQYIHRVGRTARAGKGGSGVLLLAPFEERAVLRCVWASVFSMFQLVNYHSIHR